MKKFKWINIFKGFGMGTSDLVPGVSGGTIALLLGIYDDFISSISGLFSRRFWPSLKFLLPILVGMLIAIGLLSQLFNYLLSQHHIPTMLFFTGLILGIIPYLLTISNFKKNFSIIHYFILLLGIAIIVVFALLNHGDKHSGETLTLSFSLIIKYFIAGVFASSAMLLPGISGSFMLLVFGVYGTLMYAISELLHFNLNALPIILIVGFGIVTGFMISSRLIQYCLHQHPTMTFALIIGSVIGSLYAVFPGFPKDLIQWIISFFLLITGFLVSYVLGKITAKNEASF